MFNLTVNAKHQSLACPTLHPLTLGNWMFDVAADLTATGLWFRGWRLGGEGCEAC
jgi:ATP-binding cassette subfamily B (MDR/TAP) protein 1